MKEEEFKPLTKDDLIENEFIWVFHDEKVKSALNGLRQEMNKDYTRLIGDNYDKTWIKKNIDK